MGFLRDIIIRIKGDNTHLKTTVNDTEKQVGGLAGKVKGFGAALTAAGAAGAAAFAAILKWTKDTSWGLETMNVTLAVSKQLLTDLITKQGLHIGEAIKNAQAQSKINEDNVREQYELKTMQSELNQLITASADQTLTHAQRLDLLTRAMEKEKQIKTFLLADAKEELKVARDNWKNNIQSLDARKKVYEIMGRIRDIEGMDSRRLQSQYTSELVEQKKRAEALVEAFTPLPEDIEKAARRTEILTNKVIDLQWAMETLAESTGKAMNIPAMGTLPGKTELSPFGGTPGTNNALFGDFKIIDEWKSAWKSAISEVTDFMADTFGQVFERIGEGSFKGFGNDLLRSFGGMVAQLGKMLIALGTTWLLALTLMKTPTIPTAIAAIAAGAAAVAIGSMMVGASKRGAEQLSSGSSVSSSGGTASGGGYASSPSTQNLKLQIEGKLKGKDIYWSTVRYAEDNG